MKNTITWDIVKVCKNMKIYIYEYNNEDVVTFKANLSMYDFLSGTCYVPTYFGHRLRLLAPESRLLANIRPTTCLNLGAIWRWIKLSHIARFMRPTWGPPGSCRPQMGPISAPRTLLSGVYHLSVFYPEYFIKFGIVWSTCGQHVSISRDFRLTATSYRLITCAVKWSQVMVHLVSTMSRQCQEWTNVWRHFLYSWVRWHWQMWLNMKPLLAGKLIKDG